MTTAKTTAAATTATAATGRASIGGAGAGGGLRGAEHVQPLNQEDSSTFSLGGELAGSRIRNQLAGRMAVLYLGLGCNTS